MRVGLVSPYDLTRSGGVQQQVIELAARLSEEGAEVVLLGPGASGDGRPFLGRSMRIRANRSSVPLSLDVRAPFATRRALRQVDVVHVHEPFVPLVGWAALRSGKPTVMTFHADPPRWARRLYRLAGPIGDWCRGRAVVTAVSEVAASALSPRWDSQVIPNGIDVASYRLDIPRSDRQVVFLGRDDPRKGLDVLLEAWPMVRRRHPRAELVVVGAVRSRPPAGVVFMGRRSEDEKRRALSAALVQAAPNLGGESFGIVVAEGMASGCAVVASDIPAFRPVLGDRGVLVPPRSPAALAGAIAALLDDPPEACRLGEEARAAAARFDWARVLAAYQQCYETARAGIGQPPSGN